MENRPRARKKVVTEGGFSPFGSSGGGSSSGGSGGPTRGGSGGGLMKLIIAIIVIALGGGGGYSLLSGGGGGYDVSDGLNYGNGVSSGWTRTANTGKLNEKIAGSARDKFTEIKGHGKDRATVMVYMCGTDLESRSAMATSDLQEMINAKTGSNVDIVVYTGGCTNWRNKIVSSKVNQVYHIQNGKINRVVNDAGRGSMTDPETLKSFVTYAAKKYPSNRNMLIMWDHGTGSVTGYGYDEKYPRTGSMTLGNINKALSQSGVTFDFVGFDACLMATAETGLMLSNYADYMIASEETEPGIGWYYTDWLAALSENSSIPTLNLGKQIIDDFTSACASKCPGQQTTLSLTDLAELSATLPPAMADFAKDANSDIEGGEFKTIATARSGCREFARSSGIDQIDLVNFADKIDTNESKVMADTVIEAVKYNKTSRNITDAYGLSIYFPYKKLNKVDSMTSTYKEIGMDEDYTSCIQKFAQLGTAGQAVTGGQTNPLGSLLGDNVYGSSMGSDAMSQLIGQLLSGGYSSFGKIGLSELNSSNTKFLSEDPLDEEVVKQAVSENRINEGDLKWKDNADGKKSIQLTEDQWSNIKSADKAMYVQTSKGYYELGRDNVYDFDDDGNLLPDTELNWVAINNQLVAYYHTDTVDRGDDDYSITGRVPCKVNGDTCDLILVFDSKNEAGYVAGVKFTYDSKLTEAEAKVDRALTKGDKVQFTATYYNKDGKSQQVNLGKAMRVSDPDQITISNIDVGTSSVKMMYKFTDIFGQEYYTDMIE